MVVCKTRTSHEQTQTHQNANTQTAPGVAVPEAILLRHLLGQGLGRLHGAGVHAARKGKERFGLLFR